MGYGIPAAIAAKAVHPDRPAIAFAGDGCFMMACQELATAVQFDLPIIVVLADNGMLGTIRMHQERQFPGRDLRHRRSRIPTSWRSPGRSGATPSR